jgi:hypothetical protein
VEALVSFPIFLLSSGRSGSTLLQRLLNSYDDVVLWGEHRGFLRGVAEAYFAVTEHPSNREMWPSLWLDATPSWAQVREWKAGDRWQAWLNWVTVADVDEQFRRFVSSFFQHPSGATADGFWGFKEIRYGHGDRVVEFLSRLFPDARFVFLSRNGLNCVSSQLRTFGASGTRLRAIRDLANTPMVMYRAEQWRAQNASLLEWHRSGRIRSFWIAYEDLLRSSTALSPLLSDLGKVFGADQRAVLESDEGRGASFSAEIDVNARWRELGVVPAACLEMVLGDVNASLGYETPRGLGWARRLRWLAPALKTISRRKP